MVAAVGITDTRQIRACEASGKSINGLAILVEEMLGREPFSEQLLVFCNRKRNGSVM